MPPKGHSTLGRAISLQWQTKDSIVSVEPERSEVIHGPNRGGFLGLAPDL